MKVSDHIILFIRIFFKSFYTHNLHYEKFSDGTVKCIEDEIPFDVPDGWVWCRFGTLTLNRDSERKPISSSERKNIDKIYDYYGASGKIDKMDKYLFDERLLLIGEDGANLITRSKPIAFFAEGKYWVNNHAHCIDATNKQYLDYLCYYINAINLEYYVTGAAQPKMNQDNMNRILVSLPPFKEQLTIIDKINNIFNLVEYIDENKTDLNNVSSLIKSKILDLAIQGKLVPQNQNDEPASVLLERIKAQKEELIKQGKIKRDKKESVIFKGEDNSYYRTYDKFTECIEEKLLFDLPTNWCWVTMPNIAQIELGKTLDKAKNTGKYHPYIRSVNVQWGNVDLTDVKEMKFEDDELERYSVRRNDMLICEGGDVGRCCIWELDESILYQNALHRVRFYDKINCKFYMYLMMFFESKGILKKISNGVTIKHLTGTVLSGLVCPLPPIEEQKRIVDAIETAFEHLDNILNNL